METVNETSKNAQVPAGQTGKAVDQVEKDEAPSRYEAVIEKWFNDHFPGSIVGRDTKVWNHVFRAKEALKTIFKSL